MKLHQNRGEPKPRRAKAGDVLGRERAPEESEIPWERMAEQYKPQMIEFCEQAESPDDLVAVHAILLLFPELKQQLHFSEERFKYWTTFPEGSQYFIFIRQLLEIFPERHPEILNRMDSAMREAKEELRQAADEQPPDYEKLLLFLSYAPQYFNQYKDVLSQGKKIFLEVIRTEKDDQSALLPKTAGLVLFFPDLRPDIQNMVAERQTDLLSLFRQWSKDPLKNDKPDIFSLALGLAELKIIYAESAGYREDWTIYIEDQKPLGPPSPPLPARNLAS